MKRVLKALALVFAGGVVIAFLSLAWLQAHSQQLWRVVNQRCLSPEFPDKQVSACLRVDRRDGYVVFNDKQGPLHTLLIPSAKISGIESPALLSDVAKDYFHFAWDNRELLKQQTDVSLADPLLALAINSYYGRTQNQLHIHLACLKPEIYQQITAYSNRIDRHWRILPFSLAGHQYWAKEVDGQENPVKVLAQWVVGRAGKMADYGLVRLVTTDGRTILLASQAKLNTLNRGSVESLLDGQCHLAQSTGSR